MTKMTNSTSKAMTTPITEAIETGSEIEIGLNLVPQESHNL